MSGGDALEALDGLIAVADGDDGHVLIGKRQFDDALNRDAVVCEKEGMRHGLTYRNFRLRLQEYGCFRAQTRARTLALMKPMMSCMGVPGRKMPLTPDLLQLRDVDVGDDAADHDEHVVESLLPQQFHQARRDVVVGARQDRQADARRRPPAAPPTRSCSGVWRRPV